MNKAFPRIQTELEWFDLIANPSPGPGGRQRAARMIIIKHITGDLCRGNFHQGFRLCCHYRRPLMADLILSRRLTLCSAATLETWLPAATFKVEDSNSASLSDSPHFTEIPKLVCFTPGCTGPMTQSGVRGASGCPSEGRASDLPLLKSVVNKGTYWFKSTRVYLHFKGSPSKVRWTYSHHRAPRCDNSWNWK